MKRRSIAIVAIVVAITVVGAGVYAFLSTPSSSPRAPADAKVRVLQASPDAPALDVWVNGATAFSNVTYEQLTPYASLAPGTDDLKVVLHRAASPAVIETNLTLASATDYTVVAVGELAQVHPLVLVDTTVVPPTGDTTIRFVHASPDTSVLDFAVHSGPVLFSDVAFGHSTAYANVTAGTYALEMRLTGTSTVVLALGNIPLRAGIIYTVFATGLTSQNSLAAVLATDGTNSTPAIIEAARGHMMHAATDAPAINVTVTGGPTWFSSVPFGQYSNYLNVTERRTILRESLPGRTRSR